MENIEWHQTNVTKKDREILNSHKSVVVWLTGLSGSGKSTIANAVEKVLHDNGIHTYLLDGDNLRHGINENLGFSPEDRKENIRRISEIARLFVDAGIVVLVSAISPFKKDREAAMKKFEHEDFIEVYVQCSLEECERRDPKGLYKKARAGEIKNFTGVSQSYEEPSSPDIVIHSDQLTIEGSVSQLSRHILNEIK